MDDSEFDAFVEHAVAELKVKQDAIRARYGMGEYARWWYDQEKETIQFIDHADRVGLEVEFIDIGSFSRTSRTWKWAWCNDYVLPKVRARAEPLKELSVITGMEIFAREEPVEIDEEMAWELAAISVQHLSAVGCYRAPTSDGELYMFFALMKVHRIN